jgi:energy-coupling factor transporter ATP-binding protein EcfA2
MKNRASIMRDLEAMSEEIREELEAHENGRNDSKNFFQWSIVGDGSFLPAAKTILTLQAGFYEPVYNDRAGDWGLMKMQFNTDELYQLPTQEIQEILDDIKHFWETKHLYQKYKLMHKRGILLYGDPGCGKSGIIQLCMKYLIEEQDGLIINIKDSDSLRGYLKVIPKIRQIEPNRPLIIILEDLEAIADDDNYATSQLLNLLDGVSQVQNVVYIATTNYPEKLAERITNRPSRFDRRYYIAPPIPEVRRAYLEQKLGEEMDIDIDAWVKDSEGMSIAHLKELFISVKVLGNSYESALANLNGMKLKPRGKGQSQVGFSR